MSNQNINNIIEHNKKKLQVLMETACLAMEGDMSARAAGKYGEHLKAKDLGNYEENFKHKIEQEGLTTTGRIGNSTPYGHYIEFGTGEYAEKGNGRKGGWFFTSPRKLNNAFALYQNKKGEYVYFTLGMKPRPIMRTAAKEMQKQIKQIFGVK